MNVIYQPLLLMLVLIILVLVLLLVAKLGQPPTDTVIQTSATSIKPSETTSLNPVQPQPQQNKNGEQESIMMASPQDFVGHWTLANSENFDTYLTEINVGFMLRKIAVALKMTLDITVDGKHWKIVTGSTFKTVALEFDLGKEFEEITGDNRKMKTTITFENGKLIQVQKAIKKGDKDSVFERYIDNKGQIVVLMKSGNVVAQQTYTKD